MNEYNYNDDSTSLDFLKNSVKDLASFKKLENIYNRLLNQNPELKSHIPPKIIFEINSEINATVIPNSKYETSSDIENNLKTVLNELESEKVKNKELKDKKQLLQINNINKENEYRDIINSLSNNLSEKSYLNEIDKQTIANINDIKNTIMSKLELMQQKTSKILKSQEKDIIEFYNAKIIDLKNQFELENERQNLRDLDFLEKESKLVHELEWIKKIAEKIDNENHNIIKKYKELNIENYTKNNDKNMIMKLHN